MTDSSEDYEFAASARRRRTKQNVRQSKYPRLDWDTLEYFESDEETNYLKSLQRPRGPGRRVIRDGSPPSSADEPVEDSTTSPSSHSPVEQWEYTPDLSAAVETVLDHRMGLVGATGDATTSYNCRFEGDPNEGEGDREIQYLIKWRGLSYIHATWETQESLRGGNVGGLQRLRNYNTKRQQRETAWKSSDRETQEYMAYEEELRLSLMDQYRRLERIICEVTDEYLCKWSALPYAECTYELTSLIHKLFPEAVEEFNRRRSGMRLPTSLCRVLMHRPRFVPLVSQPECLSIQEKLRLRDYQLEGLNWLLFGWCRNTGGILADEMGLGKTVQVIAFLNYLFNTYSLHGPFMIVVPLSTVEAWKRECGLWSPEMNCVCYVGDMCSRERIREYEWWLNARIKFNVLLTTYEILLKDDTYLSDINWACLIVDEAHRLKNDESILYKTLISYNTNHRILMSGTPLQNTLRELWALLAFLNPYNYCEWADFEARHTGTYERLHDELKPILLRRMKQDVEKSLPAKVERILRVELSALQKQYYKWIVTRNFMELTRGTSKRSFLNIMMELQKCCNHAFLVKHSDNGDLQSLIRGSGKFILLDKLLTRLKENGHRVLIFSQMVRILDLLARYMIMKGFQFQRLDGSIRGEVRKQSMDHFNADNSNDFCFLLSTRAGGLGLNLASADTVIIFDSDWNPQNDLQAQARAHRIGQTKQVTIYRLVSKDTVEQSIIERAKKKMVLDHLVIQRMDTSGKAVMANKDSVKMYSKEDLSAILAFGAENLFKEKEGDEQEPNVDIDEILNLAESSGVQPQSSLLSQFKVVNFNYTEEDEGPKTWEEIIPLSYRTRVFEEPTERTRQQIVPTDSDDSDVPRRRRSNNVLNKTEMLRFVRSFKKFPDPLDRIQDVMVDASLSTVSLAALRRLAYEMYRRCCDAYRQFSGGSKKTPLFVKMCSTQVNVRLLLEGVDLLQPLTRLSSFGSDEKERLTANFVLVEHSLGASWTGETDWAMLNGIVRHGYRNWQSIREDPELDLTSRICPLPGSKTPYKPFFQRAEQLLKVLKDFDTNAKPVTLEKAKNSKSSAAKTVKMTLRSTKVNEEEVRNEESEDDLGNLTERAQLSDEVFNECKDNFRSHKMNLKKLCEFSTELQSGDANYSEIVQNVRDIGDHIECVVGGRTEGGDEWRRNYWIFVSLFTSVTSSELEKYYRGII